MDQDSFEEEKSKRNSVNCSEWIKTIALFALFLGVFDCYQPVFVTAIKGGNPKINSMAEKIYSGEKPTWKTKETITQKNQSKPALEAKSARTNQAEKNVTNNPTIINVANVLIGASVDNEHSSSSSLTSFFGGNQVGYVILDRQYLREHTAWCSTAEPPILTVNLANYSKPVAVSYQHAEWDGFIPDETPKQYEVMGCLDPECKIKKIIASNCKYLPNETQSGPEQKCQTDSEEETPLINKVQFVFRSNHGNAKQTCVNLVRVYAEDHRVPEIKTEKELKQIQRVELENERTCAYLANWYYDVKAHYPKEYAHCVTIYSKNCCLVCPQCCEECTMEDTFMDTVNRHPVVSFLSFTFLILLTWCLIALCFNYIVHKYC